MEPFVILLILTLIGFVFVLPIIALVRAGRAVRDVERLTKRLTTLEVEIVSLKRAPDQAASSKPTPAFQTAPPPEAEVRSAPTGQPLAATLLEARGRTTEDLRPVSPTPAIAPVAASQTTVSRPSPPLVNPIPQPPPLEPEPKPKPAFGFEQVKGSLNWEQFMGAKLFAWVGGLALFLGVAYFVKYSFEHDLIPPEVRVALGFLVGIALVVGGVMMRRKEYTITSQTLSATGIVSLYAVTFACRAVYHFAFFGPAPTFALMSLITATAFLLSVRLDAPVVAILGMLGGFLTPILLSTGQDAPVALFGYIALLDAGLLAVALHRRWMYLAPLAAAGTILMQIGWAVKFFTAGEYFLGNKVLVPMAVLLGFNALWLGAAWLARRREKSDRFVGVSTAALAAVAIGFAFYFLSFASLGARPWLVFSFAFLVDIGVLTLTRLDRQMGAAHPVAGAAIFLLLAVWLAAHVTNELLPAALVFTLVFATFHSLLPLALQRRDGVAGASSKWSLLFPPVALLVLLVPIIKLTELTVFVWPVILLVDVLAVALAGLVASALPVLLALGLTLLAAVGVLFKIPAELTGLPMLLLIVGACAVFFAVAGVWLRKRLPAESGMAGKSRDFSTDLAAQIPAFAIVLPFVLLVMMVGRLPLANPSPVFALAMLLTGMLFAVSRLFRFEWLPLIGLGCVAALECAWHQRLFDPDTAVTPLIWYLAFYAAYAAFPFVLRQKLAATKGPWVAAALAGPAQFLLIHQLVKTAWPNHVMGLLPVAFAVPALFSLVVVLRSVGDDSRAKQTQLAVFGGVGLFFITLIFPIQFERQWLTIAWALEGAALCWLFHRVPHPGLRVVGVVLLVTAFARLALNPAVLSYHPRSQTPIFNWYLYSYGLVTAGLFAGARLLAPPRNWVIQTNAPVLLYTLGAVLAFLLVNIQIADFFTAPGAAALTFKFSGNFARDMTYSIAWAIFALGLLIIGLMKRVPPARYAAIGLLGVTVVKLFFHDLAELKQLYRVGALFGVAVIAIIASFLYQRFIAANAKSGENATIPPTLP